MDKNNHYKLLADTIKYSLDSQERQKYLLNILFNDIMFDKDLSDLDKYLLIKDIYEK